LPDLLALMELLARGKMEVPPLPDGPQRPPQPPPACAHAARSATLAPSRACRTCLISSTPLKSLRFPQTGSFSQNHRLALPGVNCLKPSALKWAHAITCGEGRNACAGMPRVDPRLCNRALPPNEAHGVPRAQS